MEETMNKEELYKLALSDIPKYDLLNEIFAIQDNRFTREQADNTICVNGFISLDVIKKYINKINKLQQIREYCEETVNRNKKELTDLEALPSEEYKVNESWNEYHKGYYLAEKELCEGFLQILNSGGTE